MLKEFKNIERIRESVKNLDKARTDKHSEYSYIYDITQQAKYDNLSQEEVEKLIEETKEKNNIVKQEEEQIAKDLFVVELERDIISNNASLTFFESYYSRIIDILRKYQGKNIGEKTKEKICNAIKELIYQDISDKEYDVYPYYSNGEYSHDLAKIIIQINKKEEYYNKFINVTLEFSTNYKDENVVDWYFRNKETDTLIKTSRKTEDDICCYDDYVYVVNPNKIANDVYKKYKKVQEKKEALIKELKELRKEHDKYVSVYGFNHDINEILKINANVNLY